jgi:uncharacterized protein GlcG (DUF336 family)
MRKSCRLPVAKCQPSLPATGNRQLATFFWVCLVIVALPALAQRRRVIQAPPAFSVCDEGSGSFQTLTPVEIDAVVKSAASALNVNTATIAVVDRAGRILALFRQPAAGASNDDQAVGVARTAAFFSHNMAPLSSRTVRFISGIHFPPGVQNTPNAPLYGIENTNRGCDLGVIFNPGKALPPAKSVTGGVGPGIVTGKPQPDDGPGVNAGGVPIYKAGKLVGGVGVVGIAGDPQLAEFAAASGAFAAALAPVPTFPLPEPGNVFIDGIRLPLLGPDQRLGPAGLERPAGTQPGSAAGGYVTGFAPVPGQCAANEYLVGPKAGSLLTQAQVDAIVQRAVSTSKRTRAIIRLPLNSYARMVIAVSDINGDILALYRMPDATVFSVDVSVAKARNVVNFSISGLPGVPAGTAISNRTIGFGAQPLYPPGIDGTKPGPFFSIFLNDLANPCGNGGTGIVFFPGASPLYANGKLVGGLGVSGDGVEQDDYVTYFAAGELLPDPKIWADQVKVDGVRLPMFKFPRQPEGVTECGGGPCG